MSESKTDSNSVNLRFFRDPYIVVALLLIVITRIIFFIKSGSHLQTSGDEGFYFSRAKTILNILQQVFTLDWNSIPKSWDRVINNGWFLPGMSTILMPVRIFTDSVVLARLYILAINLGLGILMLRRVFFLLGKENARLLGFLMAFFPAYIVFSFTFWGETVAGHLAVLLVLHIYSYLSASRNDFRFTLRHTFQAALLLSAIIYVRPNFILLAPVTVICYFFAFLYTGSFWKAIRGTFSYGAFMAIVTIVLLMPWSASVSQKHGGFYLLTTSYDIGIIKRYADEDFKQQVRQEHSNTSIAFYKYYMKRSKEEGKSYAEVVKEDRDRFLSEVAFEQYFIEVKRNVQDYFFSENGFLSSFKGKTETSDIESLRNYYMMLTSLNTVFWYTMLFITLLVLILIINPSKQLLWVLFAQLFFIAVAAHPFYGGGHGRHHIGLLSLMLLLGSFVMSQGVQNVVVSKIKIKTRDISSGLNLLFQIFLSVIVICILFLAPLYLFVF